MYIPSISSSTSNSISSSFTSFSTTHLSNFFISSSQKLLNINNWAQLNSTLLFSYSLLGAVRDSSTSPWYLVSSIPPLLLLEQACLLISTSSSSSSLSPLFELRSFDCCYWNHRREYPITLVGLLVRRSAINWSIIGVTQAARYRQATFILCLSSYFTDIYLYIYLLLSILIDNKEYIICYSFIMGIQQGQQYERWIWYLRLFMIKRLGFLFSQAKRDVVFTGIQPTGNLHIGNYLGSIQNIIKLQNLYPKLYLSVVDYHALTNNLVKVDNQITVKGDLAQETIEMYSTLLACGVDPDKTTVFIQSQVPQHAELCWILGCITPHYLLNSMIQYKEKKLKNDNPSLGLYSYPVLMAADIILYGATKVPVGSDQVQHLELTSKIIERFNKIYGGSLPKPEYIASSTPRVMSLTDGSKKMSKSNKVDKSRINLTDDNDAIRAKIMKAKTDCIQSIYSSPERVEISNLITLYASFNKIELGEANQRVKDKTVIQFKRQLVDSVIQTLEPIRVKLEHYKNNPQEVKRILELSQQKARKEAEENIRQIKRVIGMYV